MKNNLFTILKPAFILTAIAAAIALLLGSTNLLTADKIAKLSEKAENDAVAKVIKAEAYEKYEIEYDDTIYNYYAAITDEETIGYAFNVSKNGYGGAVSSIIGITKNGKISAVELISLADETPGLGQNAKSESFLSQFKAKNQALEVVKSNPDQNQIKAVTGATITSSAVTDSVNLAFELFQLVREAE